VALMMAESGVRGAPRPAASSGSAPTYIGLYMYIAVSFEAPGQFLSSEKKRGHSPLMSKGCAGSEPPRAAVSRPRPHGRMGRRRHGASGVRSRRWTMATTASARRVGGRFFRRLVRLPVGV
jgi:hypothetical protein